MTFHQLSLFDQPTGAPDLVLALPPSVNTAYKTIVIKGTIRRALSSEAKQYKAMVAEKCAEAGMQPLSGRVWLILNYYSLSAASDPDNRVKILQDAMIGWAYLDDKQVRRTWIEAIDEPKDSKNPRVEVFIRRLE